MKFLKLNFRQTTSVYINDVPRLHCYGNSPLCLKTYLPTRLHQPVCLRCLEYFDPYGIYKRVDIKKLNYKKIKIILEI